jgi:hypothetical protein
MAGCLYLSQHQSYASANSAPTGAELEDFDFAPSRLSFQGINRHIFEPSGFP